MRQSPKFDKLCCSRRHPRGYAASLVLLPGGPDHIATVSLSPGPRQHSDLYEAIADRHSNCGPYQPSPLPASLLTGLAGLAAGGLAVAAAPWVSRRTPELAAALLLAGSVPFAAFTWWSIAAPLTAVLALAIGLPTALRHRQPARTGAAAHRNERRNHL